MGCARRRRPAGGLEERRAVRRLGKEGEEEGHQRERENAALANSAWKAKASSPRYPVGVIQGRVARPTRHTRTHLREKGTSRTVRFNGS